MNNSIAILFVDVLQCEALLNLYLVGNYFLNVSTVSEFSHMQLSPKLLADSGTNSLHTALYDYSNSSFDIPFHEIWAETNPNMR